jgi:hypothetical protein
VKEPRFKICHADPIAGLEFAFPQKSGYVVVLFVFLLAFFFFAAFLFGRRAGFLDFLAFLAFFLLFAIFFLFLNY